MLSCCWRTTFFFQVNCTLFTTKWYSAGSFDLIRDLRGILMCGRYPFNDKKWYLPVQFHLVQSATGLHMADWTVTEKYPDMTDATKRKQGHLRSQNNPKQHRNNTFGQQKCIPHACIGLIGHLPWHSDSLALLPLYIRLFKHAIGTKQQMLKPGLILALYPRTT